MKPIIALAILALIALPAAAQDESYRTQETPDEACPEGTTATPEGCSQQAWIDDCPPDMLCAASDCGGCEYWSTPPTCMDGTDAGEECRPDVQYLSPGDGPDNTGALDDEHTGQDARGSLQVPYLELGMLGLAMIVAALAITRK